MSSVEDSEKGLGVRPPSVNAEIRDEKLHSDLELPDEDTAEQVQYLHGFQLNLMVAGLTLAILLVFLDNAILATAIPTITTAFNSLDDVGWYGSAFFITVCACQPISGKLFQQFSLKWTYLSCLFVFELGSLVCGAAPSSNALIAGRAIAGSGAAGLFSGALTIVAHTIHPTVRPAYTGVVIGIMQIAGVAGPLLGGVLTQHASWRWCFYINLPCGAVTAVLLVIFLKIPKRHDEEARSSVALREKISHLDLPGFALFLPAIVMLLLAIQWGGNQHPWKSSTIIGLLCGAVATLVVFGVWQWYQQDDASIPPRIILQRSILSGALANLFLMGSGQLTAYYLPIWFQVSKGVSPTKSGVMFLPAVISTSLSSMISGVLVTKLGYLNPWLFLGCTLIAIGSGLLSTLQINSGSPHWIGFQVLQGAGMGSSVQMPLVACMVVLSAADVSVGTAILSFFQFLGAGLFLAIGENIFNQQLLKELAIKAPNVDAHMVVLAGATAIRRVVDAQNLTAVLEAYNVAIVRVFYLCAAGGVAAIIAAFGMEWLNVKGKDLTPGAGA